MGPPTEQLIRDYLNRLSVAARDRLGPDDRRALLERTRKLIERKADFAGRPSTLEVGKVLARLGDPAALVEQEWRRLVAVRGELPGDAAQRAETQRPELAESWEYAGPAEPGGSRRLLARVLRRDIGRGWRSDAGWPTAVVGDTSPSGGGAAPPGTAQLKPEWPSGAGRGGAVPAHPLPDLPGRNGTLVGAQAISADPDRAETGKGGAVGNGTNGSNGSNGGKGANGSNGGQGTNGSAVYEAEDDDYFEYEQPERSDLVSGALRRLERLVSVAWQQPLETTAIILLGLGGLIFPPVFLLGALVAIGSRSWHYRDKWVGLVTPPLLTVIGVAAGIAIGGRSHGLHDAWVSLNVVSRLAALVGAGYLAWRTGRGRRQPPAPPWHKPRRVAGS